MRNMPDPEPSHVPRRLTKKQKDFADKYLETGKLTDSYIEVYDHNGKRETAEVEASRTLRLPQVQNYTEEHIAMAKSVIAEIASNSDNKPSDRLAAARDILNRTEGMPVQRNINANTDTDKEYRWAE